MRDQLNTSSYVRVASLADFPPSGLLRVEVEGGVRVLARLADDDVRALDGICTHQHAELADGDIEDGVLWCPFHGAGFDLQSGAAACPPAELPLRTYDVRIEDGEIFVAI